MKRVYTAPVFDTDFFEADSSVAACYSGTLFCAIPGDNKNYINDGTKENWQNLQAHGAACAESSVIFNTESATGNESNGSPIKNVSIGTPAQSEGEYCSNSIGDASTAAPGLYHATWTSTSWLGIDYRHYGMIRITAVDSTHPNRS